MSVFGHPRRPRPLGRAADALLAYALVGILIALAAALMHRPQREFAGEASVVDGDTLRLAGDRIRLLGLDAPELDQICEAHGDTVACGRRAREALRALAVGGVRCAADGRDRYGRILARCSGAAGDLSAAMVRAGEAVASGCCAVEEVEARRAGRGIWAGRFELPSDWRREHRHGDSGPGGVAETPQRPIW